ncbi:hypothetical protein ACJVQT_23120 [Enterobacter huaxiensis]|uniref:hypothetical protein n=1 Tax=Enterobacter huaxiensis TaxID=2494702 RepID=UPI002176034E|nr:hypothetical protein [Enterobacter huaxiensis]MCS5452470.1 hypothetical protein [Enterobacter huaxiensis]
MKNAKRFLLLAAAVSILAGCNTTPRLQQNQIAINPAELRDPSAACLNMLPHDADTFYKGYVTIPGGFSSDSVIDCVPQSHKAIEAQIAKEEKEKEDKNAARDLELIKEAQAKRAEEVKEVKRYGRSVARRGGSYSEFVGDTLYSFGPGTECVSTPDYSECN